MKQFIDSVGGPVPAAILGMVCVNVGLSAVVTICDKIKAYTKSQVDDRIADVGGKVVGAIQKLIDFVQGNIQHKA